ncbi:MAG TPA: zinc ribbon domain-containing protein [Candidatus Sumerlaeota bacterium]|nr:zinc ribbon domain-containing protein [Candidatus Sumerlaeota bacterium]
MSKQISEERKVAYYAGGILMVLGGLLFFSTFITGINDFGNFSHFDTKAQVQSEVLRRMGVMPGTVDRVTPMGKMHSTMLRAMGGMVLLIVGGIIRQVGATGLAGSGVILDPDKARQDLEPYSRMAGGMVKDALNEAELHLGGSPQRVIMIKCPACGKLNEEDSKFCQECGKPF